MCCFYVLCWRHLMLHNRYCSIRENSFVLVCACLSYNDIDYFSILWLVLLFLFQKFSIQLRELTTFVSPTMSLISGIVMTMMEGKPSLLTVSSFLSIPSLPLPSSSTIYMTKASPFLSKTHINFYKDSINLPPPLFPSC